MMFALRKTLKPPSVFTTIHRLISTVKLPEPESSAAYDDLITNAGRNRDFAAVRDLLNQRYTNGFFPTNNTFKFISTDLSVLNDVLQTLADLNGKNIRIKSYESLISCLCKNHLIEEALRVAEVAAAGGASAAEAVANASTFHPILSLLTRKKVFDRAWSVIEIMKSKKIARDVTCYNYFLTAYSVAGDLRSNVDVLKKMAEEGIKADARTYDALVLGACKGGKMDGAMAIMRKMEDDGVEAMYATYAHIIVKLVNLDYCAQAVKFVMSYAGRDSKLDLHNFGLLAARLLDAKKVDETKCVLQEMVKRKLNLSDKLSNFYNQNVKVDSQTDILD
ncbi:pentatricopeptide repeat-containing protein At2g40240, mitochondrial [Rutidosis leptorrhynchoides]|uniref:pentatricopeptide repeat-containing protein At2g40240, mitochondrial n=1 Tax=Rutidosis leptorrhynchoides TaxID=125765 RepID=UPI003A998DC8